MADPDAGQRLKIFISYSRRDSSDFADELLGGLELAGFAPFLDRHDIAAGEDWEARLGGLISQADTVVFVVSPEAVKSERCAWEVERTAALSKRILPVIFKPVPVADIPEGLARLQFVRFDTGGLTRPLVQLATALRQDLDWIREHTRIGELAARWQARGHPESLLLRGDDLDAVKAWMAARNEAAPEITTLQRAFLDASAESETARLGRERAQLEDMRHAQAVTARSQKRAAWLLSAVATLIVAMLGYVAWQSRDLARREILVFTSLAAEAIKAGQYDRAMRYALQAYPARGGLPWLTPFSNELESKLAGAAQSSRLRLVLKAGAKEVLAVAFSPDGKRIATASDDYAVRLWDAERGTMISVAGSDYLRVSGLAFSPDGRRLLSTSSNSGARLWDGERGSLIARLGEGTGWTTAAFSPSGKRILTAPNDGPARVWETERGALVSVLTPPGMIREAAFSPDGRRVVTVGDNKVFVYDVEGANPIVVPVKDVPVNDVRSATFSPDGKRVVATSSDYTVRVVDLDGGEGIPFTRKHTSAVTSVAFGWNGKRILTAAEDKTARLWDDKGGEIGVLEGHTGFEVHALFSPEGRRIVTTSRDDSMARLWDPELGAPIAVLANTATVTSATFSNDSRRLVTTSSDGTARLWDAERGAEIAVLMGHALSLTGAAFSQDSKRLVTGSKDGTARLWDAERGIEIAVQKKHLRPLTATPFSPDGKHMLTASDDGVARLWDVERGTEIILADGHVDKVTSAVFSADGKRVVTASDDGKAAVWDVERGTKIILADGHVDKVTSAVFSADGKRVVTASGDPSACIFDAGSGKRIGCLPHERSAVRVVHASFSPDGKRLLTEPFSGPARLWNLEKVLEKDPPEPIASLPEHDAVRMPAVFSRDGKYIVTAAMNGTAVTLHLWDGERGTPVGHPMKQENTLFAAAFGPDGTRVVTASSDGTARIWGVDARGLTELLVLRHDMDQVVNAAFAPDGRRVVTASNFGLAHLWDAEGGSRIAILKNHQEASFTFDGTRILAVSDGTARVTDVTWATLTRGGALRERVCTEKLVGVAQEFTREELADPILRDVDPADPVARSPCLRRGPLSLDYWTRLPGDLWRALRKLTG